jgi:hypothetical protein
LALTKVGISGVKILDNFRDFKRKLKLFLLDHPSYSLNEFFIFEEDNRTNT